MSLLVKNVPPPILESQLFFLFFLESSRLMNALMGKWERGRSLFLATLLQSLRILIWLVVQCLHEGDQCKIICISSNRSLSLSLKRLMLLMASCRNLQAAARRQPVRMLLLCHVVLKLLSVRPCVWMTN